MPEESIKLTDTNDMCDTVNELLMLEKTDKSEFFKQLCEFYRENKFLISAVSNEAVGYGECGKINMTIAEEFNTLDNKCLCDYELYLKNMKGVHRQNDKTR